MPVEQNHALKETVTTLLCLDAEGHPDLMGKLFPLVYTELRQMAQRHLVRERAGHTLNTTALVHEVYLKLVDHTQVTARGKTYFFGAAARAMRRILVDYARHKTRQKRGGDAERVTLDETQVEAEGIAMGLIDLDEALQRLEKIYPRQAQVVECRFFGGRNVEETAEVLGISSRTVKNDWALSKAWLFRELAYEG